MPLIPGPKPSVKQRSVDLTHSIGNERASTPFGYLEGSCGNAWEGRSPFTTGYTEGRVLSHGVESVLPQVVVEVKRGQYLSEEQTAAPLLRNPKGSLRASLNRGTSTAKCLGVSSWEPQSYSGGRHKAAEKITEMVSAR